MESMLDDLAVFYNILDQALQPFKKTCGACGECCRKASRLQVFPLELQNIGKFVKNDYLMKKFIDFTKNKIVKIWGDVEGQCPFQDGNRCSIYAARPYFCRVYGPYNYRGKNLLAGCVYSGHSITYFDRSELPLYNQFLNLMDKGSRPVQR